jgi:hypothetical protein
MSAAAQLDELFRLLLILANSRTHRYNIVQLRDTNIILLRAM